MVCHAYPILNTGGLKTGLDAVPLPLLAIGSPVWVRLPGRCSVVSFGIFTSLGIIAYLSLTQVCRTNEWYRLFVASMLDSLADLSHNQVLPTIRGWCQ